MNHGHTVVGLGEILWDVFPDGPRFGGAPANFACHAAQLGATAHMVSAIGPDELGVKALKALEDKGVNTSRVARSEFPTGVVNVELDAAGKASYQFAMNTAWDHLEWRDDWKQLTDQTAAVCFGTLGQRSESSRRAIQRFVEATSSATAFRIFDINLRPPFHTDEIILESLALANVLKLNDDELPILARLCGLEGAEVELMQALADRYQLRVVAVTRGHQGAVLCRGKEVSEFPGVSTTVKDTVGAGDSFTAALAMGLLENHALDAINQRACRIAAYVCSQSGGTPLIPADLT
jgi:fructokinase